jgi:pyridoxine 5-phosphate synthase
MTSLSINLNKIALLRNSRGRDYPNVVTYARKFIALGVDGITIHPRQDERHAKRQDAYDLGRLCTGMVEIEFNIEGYPSDDFLKMVEEVRPDQCTLVPDDVNQLTSDHGWDISNAMDLLEPTLKRLRAAGIRSSLFVDPHPELAEQASAVGADRIELYTEEYANTFDVESGSQVLERYRETALRAQELGVGVNAGHDLDLQNLGKFLEIENILEVSIGHALTIECIDQGMESVVRQYVDICRRR